MHKLSKLSCAIVAVLTSNMAVSAEQEADQDQAKKKTNTMMEVIEVTSQRRVQTLQSIGGSVSAFSDQQIETLGIENATDVAQYTPGFTVTDAGASSIPVYTIRGIGFDDTSANSSSTVGIYVDEVAMPYPIMTASQQFDMQRVEVLKGPQGDLYGRNNTAGAVNFITNKATDYFESAIKFGIGNYQSSFVEGYVNNALTDSLNGRFAFKLDNRNEGWQKNPVNGETNGEYKNYAFRISLGGELTDNISANLKLYNGKEDSQPQIAQSTHVLPASEATAAYYYDLGFFAHPSLEPFILGEGADSDLALWNTDNSSVVKTSGASLSLDFSFDDMNLISVTGYDKFDRDYTGDWDGTMLASIDIPIQKTEISSFSEELRLTKETDDYSWIVGAYYSKDNVKDDTVYHSWESPILLMNFGSVADQDTETAALFAHGEYQINDKTRLIAGLRYTDESREINNCTVDVDGSFADTLNYAFDGIYFNNKGNPAEANSCVHLRGLGTMSEGLLGYDVPDVEIPGSHNNTLNTKKWSGKLGINYDVSDEWMLYASVANSFKSGGFNTFSALVEDQFLPYGEETLTSYEIGAKGQLLEDTLSLNTALFYYDYRDKQLSTFIQDPIGIFPTLVGLVNVPKSSVTGGELELRWAATEELTFITNATYLKSKVEEFDAAIAYDPVAAATFAELGEDPVGLELPNSPKLSYTLMAMHEKEVFGDKLLRSTLSYTYQSKTKTQIALTDLVKIPSYGVADARVSLESLDATWRVSLWAKNLTNENYFYGVTMANDSMNRYAGMPRTFGIDFKYMWE